ncbi:MAG TPA: tRNA (adenosine(37)-N6)-threonylcarbamoyltransferase complex dimerization subunit type 1 TsaB [Chloroflexota bacterium]|nr:tRNA (adenosine(37)-N6)-threonylcarbamoyltransferase complex dimerization subunit type 1 TsaB [Chloroflexota bacterium]
MKVLALESSTVYASVAITDDEPLFVQSWLAGRDHSRTLAPSVQHALAACAMEPRDLDGIAVSVGPGSYTGIRVGMSLAKGMALPLGLPLAGVSTLYVLALACGSSSGPICPVVPAGAGHVAIAVYAGPWPLQEDMPARSVSFAEAASLIPNGALLCGPGAADIPIPAHASYAPASLNIPSAAFVATAAEPVLRSDSEATDLFSVTPNYLRPSSAEERLVGTGVTS